MEEKREQRRSEQDRHDERIRMKYDSLSRSQKKIARYILENAEKVSGYSITQLSGKLGTAPSTITRFCQALSFKGFGEFKVYLEKGQISSLEEDAEIEEGDTTEIVMQKMMKSYQKAVYDSMRTLAAGELRRVADEFLKAKRIVFFGQSSGYVSALYACQIFLRAGISSQAVNGGVDAILTAAVMEKGDVAVGIAYSGEATAVIKALDRAGKSKAVTVAITANPGSTMAKCADYKLLYSHNIPDDLRYHYQAGMCEIAVLGALQAEILRRPHSREQVEKCKNAILSGRKK